MINDCSSDDTGKVAESLVDKYSEFEKTLPLLAIGENFLISHAEPLRVFNPDEVRNYDSDAIHGLTWTANDEAEEGSVLDMLEMYIPDKQITEKFYFKRPVQYKETVKDNDFQSSHLCRLRYS